MFAVSTGHTGWTWKAKRDGLRGTSIGLTLMVIMLLRVPDIPEYHLEHFQLIWLHDGAYS